MKLGRGPKAKIASPSSATEKNGVGCWVSMSDCNEEAMAVEKEPRRVWVDQYLSRSRFRVVCRQRSMMYGQTFQAMYASTLAHM